MQLSFVAVPAWQKKPASKVKRPRPNVAMPTPKKTRSSLPAPPAPSAEEWKIASTYTLKNSKRYRYDWGQLVRSKMGTAVEGPQQGQVRFRIEIAPDGKIASIVELWATSKLAEKLAWQAIRSMPPLPPTPTGKPLVFEQTISFEPFDTGWPPNYKFDFMPDTPAFHNPFAQGADASHDTPPAGNAPAAAVPAAPDSIDTEDADMQRQLDEWGRGKMNGVR